MSRRRAGFNLVDLCCLAGLAMALGAGVSSYRLMRQPVPSVTAIEPSSVPEDEAVRLTVKGVNFRVARMIMVSNVLVGPLEDLTDDSLRVYFNPKALGLPPDRYSFRVLNGWGQGEVLWSEIEVTPPLPPPTQVSEPTARPSKPQVPVPTPKAAEEATEKEAAPTPIPPGRSTREWVIVQGWLRLYQSHGLAAGPIRSGNAEYEGKNRVMAKVLEVISEGSEPIASYLVDGQIVRIVPAKQVKRAGVILKLLALQREGVYQYKGLPLLAQQHIPLVTSSWRADIELAGDAAPLSTDAQPPTHVRVLPRPEAALSHTRPPNQIQIDLSVDRKTLQGLDLIQPGDLFKDCRANDVVSLVERFARTATQAVVRLGLYVTVSEGAVWVKGPCGETWPVQQGSRLVLGRAGQISGTVLDTLTVQQHP